ncbi:MAG: hypothetical protein A2X32_03860 [Elusimicrobia bacterium GWC2_64_44]|nr:MAG: hypothetical protein A2X32_03860 [Elusimicrobia bacterium GWC2_64_44]
MAKKSAKRKPSAAPGPSPESRPAFDDGQGEGGEPRKALPLWLLAIALIISGYAMLHKVDPGGQNAWAVAAPVCLLAGYLLIIPAIVISYRR